MSGGIIVLIVLYTIYNLFMLYRLVDEYLINTLKDMFQDRNKWDLTVLISVFPAFTLFIVAILLSKILKFKPFVFIGGLFNGK